MARTDLDGRKDAIARADAINQSQGGAPGFAKVPPMRKPATLPGVQKHKGEK